MIRFVIVIATVCALGLGASLTFTWASSKSAFWNIGLGVVLVVAAAGLLVITVALLMRTLSH